jgi:hypothetical protein
MTAALPALDKLPQNPDWPKLPLFDRKRRTSVRFGDVVENVNETEREPQVAGIERFIAWSIWSRGRRCAPALM